MNIEEVARHFSEKEQVRAMSDRVAQGLFPWERRVLDEYPAQGSKVLNIGCGSGREAFVLHDLGYDIIGIDVSEGQVRRAQELCVDHGMSPSCFGVCDGVTVPFEDRTFHYVIAWSQVIGNMAHQEDRIDLLSECHRVLRKQGMCSFSGHALNYCKATYPDSVQGNTFYPFGFDSCQWHLFTKKEMKNLAEAGGLEVRLCCNTVEWGSPKDKQVLVCIAQKS